MTYSNIKYIYFYLMLMSKEYQCFYGIHNMFLLLYGRFCSVDSLVLLVYLHFTPEIDIPFVQLN